MSTNKIFRVLMMSLKSDVYLMCTAHVKSLGSQRWPGTSMSESQELQDNRESYGMGFLSFTLAV